MTRKVNSTGLHAGALSFQPLMTSPALQADPDEHDRKAS